MDGVMVAGGLVADGLVWGRSVGVSDGSVDVPGRGEGELRGGGVAVDWLTQSTLLLAPLISAGGPTRSTVAVVRGDWTLVPVARLTPSPGLRLSEVSVWERKPLGVEMVTRTALPIIGTD